MIAKMEITALPMAIRPRTSLAVGRSPPLKIKRELSPLHTDMTSKRHRREGSARHSCQAHIP